MGRIMIACPTTGQLVPTGLTLSREEFERAVLSGSVTRCPACGRIHAWTKRDASLEDESAAPRKNGRPDRRLRKRRGPGGRGGGRN